jgi:hypothetical protein
VAEFALAVAGDLEEVLGQSGGFGFGFGLDDREAADDVVGFGEWASTSSGALLLERRRTWLESSETGGLAEQGLGGLRYPSRSCGT